MWEQIAARHCGETCCHLMCGSSPIRTVSCVFIHTVPETGMQLKTINKTERLGWFEVVCIVSFTGLLGRELSGAFLARLTGRTRGTGQN